MDEKTIARFWAKVDRRGADECWEWMTGLDNYGYGKFSVKSRNVKAHRFSYELRHGPIRGGLWVLHSCDNPPCVNPAHLSLGTSSKNQHERTARGRRPAPVAHIRPRVPSVRPTLAERFWAKVDKNGPVPAHCPELGPCHVWTGPLCAAAGRGKIRAFGKHVHAHRVGFFLMYGRWPEPCGLHRCDNPACCNGAHIFAGTMGDNNRDRDAKGRQAKGLAITANRNTARGERSPARLYPEAYEAYRGSGNYNSKLTSKAVQRIIRLRAAGHKYVDIARLTGVTDGNVGHILHGRSWSHLTGIKRKKPRVYYESAPR